jgi:hypothetical protein
MSLRKKYQEWFVGPLGGPDFNESVHHQVDYGAIELDLLFPRSHIAPNKKTKPKQCNLYDLTASTDGEVSADSNTAHKIVSTVASAWSYFRPKINRIALNPYVVMTAIWDIQVIKLPELTTLFDPLTLQFYLEQDYDSFLNDEGGDNWEIRKYYHDKYSERSEPLEYYKDEIASFLPGKLLYPPNDYQVQKINDINWLRFSYRPMLNKLDEIFYIVQVSPHHMLSVSFAFTRFGTASDEKWLPKALDDIDKIMTGTSIKWKALEGKS